MEHTVKDTAARVGLPSRTLRYYDRIGLVCPPRTASGYRIYGPEDEDKLRFIRQAKTLGFSLAEIRELIAVAEQGSYKEVLPQVRRLLDEKIAAIDAQMVDLAAFRDHLVAYRAGQESGSAGESNDTFLRIEPSDQHPQPADMTAPPRADERAGGPAAA